LLELTQRAFKAEIEMGGFDEQRFKRTAKLYSLTRFLMPILDLFHIDYPTILVATIDDKVVGEAHLAPFKKRMWTIDSLAVDPTCRGRGVGFDLIKRSVDYLAKRQARRVLSSMRVDNTSANRIAQKLGYEIFEERTTLLREAVGFVKPDNYGIFVRDVKPKDAKRIHEMAQTIDAVRTQAFEIHPEDFSGSLSQTVMNKLKGTYSKRFVAESDGQVVGYAQVVYTTPKEAASAELLCPYRSDELSKIASTLLNRIADHIIPRGIKRIIVSVSRARKEETEALTSLGFTPIADMYWRICLDRTTCIKVRGSDEGASLTCG
jgi:ribosomal protein S18 acetylase RimI-like enzyme